MYKNIIITILLILSGIQSSAQINMTFDNPEFDLQQNWNGEINKFIIHNNQLWLNDTINSGESLIFIQSTAVEGAKWSFEFGQLFNPSSSNFMNIYIVMTDTIFNGDFTGYYIKIGGRTDEVSLWVQKGSNHKKIIDGIDGLLNKSENSGLVEVTRSVSGEWNLKTFNSLGELLDSNSVKDSLTIYSRYFGFNCFYTSTRADKMYLDNIIITGEPFKDIIPPFIDTVYTAENRVIIIEFSESISEKSLLDKDNYLTSLNIPSPLSCNSNEAMDRVELKFLSDFPEGSPITLEVKNLYDTAGNSIEEAEYQIYFIKKRTPQFRDIVVNEIMADPLPEVGLPNAEYIELFNASEFPYHLFNWKIGVGEKRETIPNRILFSGDFLVLYDIPTLRNSGDNIVLLSPDSTIVDSVKYKINMYRDAQKSGGGWSLEQIDPYKNCSGSENWQASNDESGGTPGFINSGFISPLDKISPQLLDIKVAPNSIILIFSEPILNSEIDDTNIQIEDLLIISIESYNPSSLKINFSSRILEGILYNGFLRDIIDCEGNTLDHHLFEFALPEIVQKGDLVINEVLFNPKPGGRDFVEVLNNSDKYFRIKGMAFSNIENGYRGKREFIDYNELFKPGDIVAFTENPELIKARFQKNGKLVKQNLPYYGDEQGHVLLLDSDSNLIDSIYYSDDFHYELLKNTEGVSLEQISPNRPYHSSNWQSASGFMGFATPGIENSNYWDEFTVTAKIIIEPEVLQPNVPGSELIKVIYNLDVGPWSANVDIYSIEGIHIAEIANNFPISNSGFFVWNGIDTQGKTASMGLYLLKFQVHNAAGEVRSYTKSVVVSGNLR